MLTLDLTNAPRWHDLAPGVRVQLRPLTTALMVATRSDPAVEAVPEEASDEERAVAQPGEGRVRNLALRVGAHRFHRRRRRRVEHAAVGGDGNDVAARAEHRAVESGDLRDVELEILGELERERPPRLDARRAELLLLDERAEEQRHEIALALAPLERLVHELLDEGRVAVVRLERGGELGDAEGGLAHVGHLEVLVDQRLDLPE